MRQLCEEKRRSVAYAGEIGKVREIQAKAWAYQTPVGWQGYAYKRADYYSHTLAMAKSNGLRTPKESLQSAADQIGRRANYYVQYILVLRMR